MSDLTEFLNARLDEEAAVADNGDHESPDMTYRLDERLQWVSVTPARVLAEVAAKRQIITEYNKASDAFEAAVDRQTNATPPPRSLSSDEFERNVAVLAGWKQAMQHSLEVDQAWTVLAAWRRAVQLLALPHAGHSDYQQMWAPT